MRLRAFLAASVAGVIGLATLGAARAADGGAEDSPRVALAPRAVSRERTGTANAIRVDVKLILIPITVTDPLGATVTGLTSETFRLFEDGVEQQIKYFSMQDAPVSLGVVFDASQSMAHKMDQSRAAVTRFFHTAIAGDEFFLVEFNNAPRLACNFTSDTKQIENTLMGIEPKNWTALFDAIYMAVNQMRRAKNPRKALLILSDGGDNYSRYTEPEMKALVREADVSIYSIALGGGGLIQGHIGLLKYLSKQTGGLFQQADKMSDLPEAVNRISNAVRHQYLLGYSSNNPKNNGLYRKIEVRLNQDPALPRLRPYWRTGYYSTDDQ